MNRHNIKRGKIPPHVDKENEYCRFIIVLETGNKEW